MFLINKPCNVQAPHGEHDWDRVLTSRIQPHDNRVELNRCPGINWTDTEVYNKLEASLTAIIASYDLSDTLLAEVILDQLWADINDVKEDIQ